MHIKKEEKIVTPTLTTQTSKYYLGFGNCPSFLLKT